MRSRVILVLFASCCVAACVVGYRIQRSQAPGKILLSAVPHELNVHTSAGEVMHSEFKLLNEGTLPVTIERIDTSCHCTALDSIDKTKLDPGESAVVRLKLTPPSTGSQSAIVTIHLGDPAKSQVSVPVHMQGQEIHPPFFHGAAPKIRREYDPSGSHPVEFEFLAVEAVGDPWVIALDSNSKDIVVGALVPRVDAEHSDSSGKVSSLMRAYRCRLDLKLLTPGQTIRGLLTPRCRTTSQEHIPTIPVMIDYPSTVQVIPSELFVSAKDIKSSVIERKVVIESRDGTSLPSFRASTSTSWIEAELNSVSASMTELRVRIRPPTEGFDDSSIEVEVQFQDGANPPIQVPIVFE